MLKVLLDYTTPAFGFIVNIMAFFGEINAVIAAGIGLMTIIYLYYKIRNEKRLKN